MLIRWSDEDRAYLVTLPEWEERVLGPVTHGDTYEEALIASANNHGEPLPTPRTYVSADQAS